MRNGHGASGSARAISRHVRAWSGATAGGRAGQGWPEASRRRGPDVIGAALGLLASLGVVACALLMRSAPSRADDPLARPISIAVADFDYADTSGEARDQQATHEARLQAFAGAIRADLAGSGKYRVVMLNCAPSPCTAGRTSPATLLEEARRVGAKLLLYGGVHKMSTLIQNGKVQVVDVEADKLMFDRLISFRGDSDEAWQHAERFLLREFLSLDAAR
jgi:uncharacterized protein DUF2380